MSNKFKVGDLIKLRHGENDGNKFGVVMEIGLDYPDTGSRRSRYALVHWTDGRVYRIYQDYGGSYYSSDVIAKANQNV